MHRQWYIYYDLQHPLINGANTLPWVFTHKVSFYQARSSMSYIVHTKFILSYIPHQSGLDNERHVIPIGPSTNQEILMKLSRHWDW